MACEFARIRDDLAYHRREADGDVFYFVKDPIRAQFFRYNELKVAMMRLLDGRRSDAEVAQHLGEQYDMEVSARQVERFRASLEKNLLLDVAAYSVESESTRRQIRKRLARRRLIGDDAPPWKGRPEAAQPFAQGLQEAETGDPCHAAGLFETVLQIDPHDARAQALVATIHYAYFLSRREAPPSLTMIPVCNPDRFLTVVDRLVGRWLFSGWGVAAICVLFYLTARAASDFRIPPLSTIGVGDFFLGMAMHFLFVLVTHETAHGLACKHYGGTVPEMGVVFLYKMQIGYYCDSSDSYLFTRKLPKLVVNFGGGLAEIIVLCLAVLAYTNTAEDLFWRKAVVVLVLFRMWGILYNWNPLVPLDGYYALSDYLGIANLRERSMEHVKLLLQRKVLGLQVEEPPLSRRERRVFTVYGVLSAVFQLLYVFFLWFRFLLPLLVRYLHAVGATIAVLYALRLVGIILLRPFLQVVRFLYARRREVFTPARSLAFGTVVAALVLALVHQRPVRAEGRSVIEPRQRAVIYAPEPGLLEDIAVVDGQRVSAGQGLARLRNDELLRERSLMAAQLAIAGRRLDLLRRGARMEELEAALAALRASNARHQSADVDASRAEALALHDVDTTAAAERARHEAVVASDQRAATRADLLVLQAGTRPEDLAQAEAVVDRLQGGLTELDRRIDTLTLRSPTAGVVVAAHIEEMRHRRMRRGDTLCEVHDNEQVYAEVPIALGEPIEHLRVGQTVALRLQGDPHHLVRTRVRLIQPVTVDGQTVSVIKTDLVPNRGWRVGMTGHARVYGPPRSTAYIYFGIPVLQIFDYRAWIIWG